MNVIKSILLSSLLGRALIVAALLSVPQLASAQQNPGGRPALAGAPTGVRAATGRITGTITDAASGKPVSYATVAVLDAATGKVVSGGVAGDDGNVVLPGIPAGSYTVQASFVGYTNETRTGVAVTAGGTLDLGKIALATSTQKLGEVVVTGQKALIEERVDRTVYNAENDQTTRGGDATDVLKRVPLLSVDLDGNVSLRGSSNIRVLINNKPSTIAASSIADALKQIPADQIKTVEVITSPSAKYDAEGSGGIINIITKTNNLRGGTLGVDVSAGLRTSNLGLNGSLRTGKMGFSLSGGGRSSYNMPGRFNNLQTASDGNNNAVSTTRQTADTRRADLGMRYNLGWDMDLDKHNALAASVQYNMRNSNNDQNHLLRVTEGGRNPGTDLRNATSTDHSNTVDASLDYTHTFEKPQQEFSILTLFSQNNRLSKFSNDLLDLSTEASTGLLRNDNNSANQEITAQLDYQTPTAKNQLLETGVKNILRRVNSDYTTFAEGSAQAPAPGQSNNFAYRQNVTAGYVAYTLGLPKNITFKPGLRYEYTTIGADFASGGAVSIPDYGVLVPSANLSRRLANGNVLKLAYNRRIQRPSLQFLNPNVNRANPLNVSQGNPRLKPEYTNNYELSYSMLVKRVNLNLSTFMRQTTGSIQAVRDLHGDTIFTSFQNIGQENTYGGSVFASVNLASKLNINVGTDMYYAVLDNKLATNPALGVYAARNQGLVISGRAFFSYNFTPQWGLQGFTFYRGRQVQLQGDQGGFGVYNLSVKRDFADKKGSIGFGADNFFGHSITIRNNIETPLLAQHNTNVLQNLGFRVNFSYRIGKLSVDQRPRGAKSINNDDLKSGEGGGGADVSGGTSGGGGGGGGSAPASGSGRPANAGSARPAGTAPVAAPAAPGLAPGSSQPTDSVKSRFRGQGRSATAPGVAAPKPTVSPADSTSGRPASLPANPINSPATTPSPGTTTPGGITPAGSPGGRP